MVAKKTKLKQSPFDGKAAFDFRGVTDQFVRVLVLMGASKAEILDAVGRSKATATLPKSANIAPGTTVQWAKVLGRWADDPRFLNSEGRPKDLTFTGKKNSFSELVELELPAENPALCRDVLLASESIVRLPSGKLRWRYRDALWRQRNVSRKRGASETVFVGDFLAQIKNVLTCSEVNLTRKISERGLYQRAVGGFSLAPEDIPEFDRVLDIHGMAFLQTIDDWLAHHSHKARASQKSSLISPTVALYATTEVVPAFVRTAKSKLKPKSLPAKLRR